MIRGRAIRCDSSTRGVISQGAEDARESLMKSEYGASDFGDPERLDERINQRLL